MTITPSIDAVSIAPVRPVRAEPTLRRSRVRPTHAHLVVVLAALLLVFPSEVAIAGPLRSNGSPVRLLGLCMVVLLGLGMLRRQRGAQAAAAPVVILALVYLAGQMFFFGWLALGGGEPAGILRDLLFSVSACGVTVFAAVRVRTLHQLHQVMAALVAGCALSALVGVAQATHLLKVQWAALVLPPGFDLVSSTSMGGERYGLARVAGTASHPIEYGVVLGACLPMALHLALHSRTHRGRRLAVAAAGAMALGLPFALSRGGLVCIGVAVLVFLAVQPWRVRLTTLVAGVVAGALAFVLAPTLSSALARLFADPSEDASIQGRTSDYPLVDAAFNAAPWLGGAPSGVAFLDNQWLLLLTQRGLVGVALFALFIAIPLGGLLATAWRLRQVDGARTSAAMALAGAIAAVAVSGGVFDLMSFGQATMLLFLAVGLSAAAHATPAQAAALAAEVRLPDGAGAHRARSTSTGPPETITLPSPRGTEDGPITGP